MDKQHGNSLVPLPPVPYHHLALCGRSTMATPTFPPKAWYLPATTVPLRLCCCLVHTGVKVPVHTLERPWSDEWVRNTCMQKSLKMLTEIETRVPANVLGTGPPSVEGKGRVRLAGASMEKLLEAISKLPSAQETSWLALPPCMAKSNPAPLLPQAQED
jgi:hypothetical protein